MQKGTMDLDAKLRKEDTGERHGEKMYMDKEHEEQRQGEVEGNTWGQ
jgi:hypothetical protein